MFRKIDEFYKMYYITSLTKQHYLLTLKEPIVMIYGKNDGEMITQQEAKLLMENYENSNSKTSNGNQLGILFGVDHIESILSQKGCVGIRIYYGKDGTKDIDPAHLILVGTDADGNDMPNMDYILDMGLPCPRYCPDTKL